MIVSIIESVPTVLRDLETGYRIVCEDEEQAKMLLHVINSVGAMEEMLLKANNIMDKANAAMVEAAETIDKLSALLQAKDAISKASKNY